MRIGDPGSSPYAPLARIAYPGRRCLTRGGGAPVSPAKTCLCGLRAGLRGAQRGLRARLWLGAWHWSAGLRAACAPCVGRIFCCPRHRRPRGPEGPWRADPALGARLAYARLARGLRGFPASVRGWDAKARHPDKSYKNRITPIKIIIKP